MTTLASRVAEPVPEVLEVERVLGAFEGPATGPTLLCVGGLHGNEPAGILGLRRFVHGLEARREQLRGSVVAVAGNVGALRAGRRFIDLDLNRAWSEGRVSRVRAGVNGLQPAAEDVEQRELLDLIDGLVGRAAGPLYAIDLHSTSGEGGVFVTVADALPNREWARHLPAPMILGLEELIEGTLLSYLTRRGFLTFGFEGGQHVEPRAVERIEAALRVAAVAAGVLHESRVPGYAEARKLLARDTRHVPRVLEVRYRHEIRPGDGFRMRPGYVNFQRVRRTEILATDHDGELRAPESARILMPLYQDQGDDGFFVVREFSPLWLHLSYLLRRLRVGSIIHWFPGVRRHPERPGALIVDRRTARFFALEILHLLGFRKHEDDGQRLVVVRRELEGPR